MAQNKAHNTGHINIRILHTIFHQSEIGDISQYQTVEVVTNHHQSELHIEVKAVQ